MPMAGMPYHRHRGHLKMQTYIKVQGTVGHVFDILNGNLYLYSAGPKFLAPCSIACVSNGL